LIRPAALTVAMVSAVAAAIVLSPPAGTATTVEDAVSIRTQTVGALFTIAPGGGLGMHFCTASVVDSPAGNLVLTAAHCMNQRTASQVEFVPDYAHGRAPFGVWQVSRVIVDQDWTSSNDPDDDFAFLVVRQSGTAVPVQRLTGGESIAIGHGAGLMVRVAGYPDDLNAMISCENTAFEFSATQLQFDCGGFTNGTSGSPLLADLSPAGGLNTVIGVIGGYELGGSTASVSYAARFNANMEALYRTALAAAN
jgi:V8-like Glu-specific endopeptidase